MDRAEVEKGIAAFSALQAPKGVYAAIGNNDLLYGEGLVRAALTKAYVTVLQNEVASALGSAIDVAGIDVYGPGRARVAETLAKAPQSASLIAIMHYPDSFGDMPANVALSLAGHSHCGQVGLPFATKFLNASDGSGTWRCHLQHRRPKLLCQRRNRYERIADAPFCAAGNQHHHFARQIIRPSLPAGRSRNSARAAVCAAPRRPCR